MSSHNTVVRLFCLVLALAFILLTSSLTNAKPTRSPNTKTSPPNSSPGTASLDLSDFGAVGNGVADDGPAFQSALDALAAAGGGTLYVPAGTYFVATPVVKDFSALSNGTITIQGVPSTTMPAPVTAAGHELAAGLDLTSQIIPATGPDHSAFVFRGLSKLVVEHVGFSGRPDAPTDAFTTLFLIDMTKAIIRHCEFYGVSSFGNSPVLGGGNIVRAVRSDLSIELSVFLGCTASSGAYGAVVENLEWRKFSITNSIFLDYGLRPFFSKTGLGAPLSWIDIGNAAPPTPESPRREFVVRDTFLDEGGWIGITGFPARWGPTAKIDLVYISGLKMNVSNLNTTGNRLYDVENLLIEKSHYGWSTNAYAAIDINRTANAIFDQLTCIDHADRLRADEGSGRLTVINSVYRELESYAQTTNVFNTTDEDDPVQYVRQQFLSALGRQPDPAAHFYWSDILIRCEHDSNCLNEKRAALIEYLNTNPQPDFSIVGTVLDENGQPLSGVDINLSDSQSVATITDSQGGFQFSNLPTSGVYSLTVNKPHYSFATSSQTITHPAANVAVSFTGRLNRHSISGRITRTDSTAAPGVAVQLSESDIAPVITDSEGYYTFSEVPAGRNYTVVPSLPDFVFTPANITVDDLSNDRTAVNFIAVVTHVSISGSVSDENDNPLSDVDVSLTGSQSETVLTDSQGNFQFMSLPVTGSYTITVSKPHYTFTTSSKVFEQPPVNRIADFTGRLNRLSISGRITRADGTALSGVTVQLAQSPATPATTDANGNYSFGDLAAGQSYTIVPSSAGFVFGPVNANFEDLSTSQTANFVGRLKPELLTMANSPLAVALDSISFLSQPFSIFNTLGLSPDGLTRVSVFARNVETAYASQISVVAEDDEGHIYPLTIDYMGDVVDQSWLKQFNIKLTSNLPTGRCIRLRLSVAEVASNNAGICIAANGSSATQQR
jgi:protocatechuate 3,4-dioxygenase beta subunit